MPKFEYIGPNMILEKDGVKTEHPANCYGGNRLRTGDYVELDGILASKAHKNPNYRRVKPGQKSKTEKEFDQLSLKKVDTDK